MHPLNYLKKIMLISALFIAYATVSFGQNSVGINTQTPSPYAVLELVSPDGTQGLLIPRLTTAQRTDVGFVGSLGSSENGLLVFDSDENVFYYWDNTAWERVSKGDVPALDTVLAAGNDADGFRIRNVGAPIDDFDAVTKIYIDDTLTIINSSITNLYDSVTNINTSISNLFDSIVNINNNIDILYDSVTNITNNVSNLYDSVTNINNNISILFDSVTNITNNVSNLYDSVTNINNNIDILYDSVTNITNNVSNLYDSVTNINNNISILYDSVTNITNNVSNLYDSVTNINNNISILFDSVTNITNNVSNLYDSVTNINNNISILFDSVTNITNNVSNLYDSVTNINNNISILYDSVTNITNNVSNLYDSVTNINNNISILFDSVTNITNNVSNLYDSVTNINNNIDILFDSVTNITNNVSNLYDSISNITNQVTNLISNPNFSLEDGYIFVGDLDDTARAVQMTGAITIDNAGVTSLSDGVVFASKLAEDLSGSPLPAGTAGHVLASQGNGTFEWINPSSVSVDPSNIALQHHFVFVGNASNQAAGVALQGDATIISDGTLTISNNAITADKILNANVTNAKLDKINIPLSGFGAAAADISLGGFNIINLADPANAQDAATKAYVDGIASSGALGLTNAHILIGSATNVATPQTITGDASLTNNGTLTISNNAITADKILNANVTNAKLDKINIPLSGFGAAAADISLGGFSIINLADPTNAQDAATKAYIDNFLLAKANVNQTMYIGTTEIAINRASGAQTLTGVSIDGNAATATLASSASNIAGGTAGRVLYQSAAGVTAFTAVGTAGQVLTSDGAGAPTWQNAATGSVTSVSVVSVNGFSGSVATATTTPAITISTSVTGLLRGDGTGISAATAGTHYVAPNAPIIGGTNTKITYDAQGLVTAGASAVLASADFAGQGGANTVLLGAGAGNPSWGQVTTAYIANNAVDGTKIALGSDATGDIMYYNGTDYVRLAIGTPGQVLKVAAGLPVWDADLNTTYTAGNGLTLSGTEFTLRNNANLTNHNVPRWDATGNQLSNSSIWDDGAGHVHIGNSTINASYALQVTGAFKTEKIYHSSDVRWKTNILPLDDVLTKVQQLRGVSYEWNRDEFPEHNFSAGTQIGLLAQEVEAVFPELVITDETGYKAVEYANLVAVLIEAIKEQQKLIDAQTSEIAKLQTQNSSMKAEIETVTVMQKQIEKLQEQMTSLNAALLLLQPSVSK